MQYITDQIKCDCISKLREFHYSNYAQCGCTSSHAAVFSLICVDSKLTHKVLTKIVPCDFTHQVPESSQCSNPLLFDSSQLPNVSSLLLSTHVIAKPRRRCCLGCFQVMLAGCGIILSDYPNGACLRLCPSDCNCLDHGKA